MTDNRTPRERGLAADAMQEIEGNPLTAAEKRMFEMFDRKGWSPEQRRSYILSLIRHKPIAAE
jgi:hypothetical protein